MSYPQPTNSSKSKAEYLLRRHKALKKTRVNWHTLWQDVADYVSPNKDDVFFSHIQGEKKTNLLFDSSATRYNRILANALYSLLTNPTIKWFEFTTGIPEVDSILSVKKWLQKAENLARQVINGSNFQTEIHSVFEDLPSFCTAVLFIEEDETDVIRFMADQIYTCYIAEDAKGVVNELSRELKWDLRQIVGEFGEDWMDDDCRREYEKYIADGSDRKYCVVQIITQKRRGKGDEGVMPFEQHFVLEHKKIILAEENFESFPAAVPRLVKLSRETYGRGPGIDSLPDIKTLNQMKKIVIMGGQLAVAPPFQGSDNSLVYPPNFKPYGMNYRRPGSEELKPLITGARPDIGLDLIQAVQADVKEAFFYDQIRLIESDRMTATEIMQRRDEQFRSFGAMLGRLNNELLKVIIDRVFLIMSKRKMFEALPPEMEQFKDIKIRYTSMIARAQSSMEAETLGRALAASATIIQSQPQTMDLIDGDEVLKMNMDIFGVNHRILRDDKEVKGMRDARAKQQQEEQQLEQERLQSESQKNQMAAAGALSGQ